MQVKNTRFSALLSLLLALHLTCPNLAYAANTHIQSALSFADRNDWENAIPHAKRSDNDAVLALVSWLYSLDRNSYASFTEISRFIQQHPEWPDQHAIRVRAEFALRENKPDAQTIVEFFNKYPPITGLGKFTYLDALNATGKTAKVNMKELAIDGWIKGDFTRDEEKDILHNYKKYFTQETHIERADRLIWEGQYKAAERMRYHLPQNHQEMMDARIAMAEDSRSASSKLRRVSKKLQDTPAVIYERIRYRARRGDDSGVRAMLISNPDTVPYPEKWWTYRADQVRKLIAQDNYLEALKLLKNHAQVEGAGLADALWLEGWIKTEYTKDYKTALVLFKRMYDNVGYPISQSRAAYWAGRAAQKLGDNTLATSWYKTAAKHTTSFYGQLAAQQLDEKTRLNFPPNPSISASDRSYFDRYQPAQALKLATQYGKGDIAIKLSRAIIDESKDTALIAQIIQTAAQSSVPHVAIHASRKAIQQHILLMDASFPTHKTPSSKPVEPALTLAITRQESSFDNRAKSPANALGMMQLLRSTAKETARKAHLGYSESRLYEADYNMQLGSLYLERMINSYDGSYVLAIASYNAGPGNVRKWIQRFGTPNNDWEQAINWMEKIPFDETRNYVQRVLENLQVYRAMESDKPLQLKADLER